MPRRKRSIKSEVNIGGFWLVWNLHREQQWCDEDQSKGLAIHVQVEGIARRELYLEYPPVITQKGGWSRIGQAQPQILPARVENHIRQAMAAGWDPDSRGKPFFYQVSELPG